MKAVVIEGFGGPDVLRVGEVPDPQAGAGQVRVAVHAPGANPVDAGIRADGTWAGLRPPHILGHDIAGVIDQVGDGVHHLRVGDRVMAMTSLPGGAGGYAELTVVDADLVAPIRPAARSSTRPPCRWRRAPPGRSCNGCDRRPAPGCWSTAPAAASAPSWCSWPPRPASV